MKIAITRSGQDILMTTFGALPSAVEAADRMSRHRPSKTNFRGSVMKYVPKVIA